MKTTHIALLFLASTLAAPALAQAQAKNDDHGAHHAAAAAAPSLTDGEVRKVDKEAKRVTIKHGEIRNLDMPPMTMVFQVKDGAMLDKVKAGDKIRFVVEQAATGLVVTEIRPAP